MDSPAIWVLIALVLIGAIAWITISRIRSQRLRQKFGSEYDRTIREEGNVRKAEAELVARAKRVSTLQIHPLSAADAQRFDDSWRAVQARFPNDGNTMGREFSLVGEVMAARGYPVGDFEQRVADVSVDHPDVVMNYRAAREIAQLHAAGKANTEDLRQAMVHYRALFRDLLETPRAEPREDVRHEPEPATSRRER